VLVAVVAADVFVGRGNVVLGLTVIAPLLAANLSGVRVTAAYAGAALAVAVLLGAWNDQYAAGPRSAQVVRLVGVAAAGALAIGAASYRRAREERLAQVTRVAEVVQRAVLPPVPGRTATVDLAVHYESAAREASVGGDFYAAVETSAGVRLLVGDVRGKGLGAVRLASAVLAAFRERAAERVDLGELLADLDRAARREAEQEDFVTALLVQVGAQGVLELASAGHPAPYVVHEGVARLVPLHEVRPPLGVDVTPDVGAPADGGTGVDVVELRHGERLLLYTDGLVEARRPGDRAFFPESLVASTLGQGSLVQGLEALRVQLLEWSGGHLHDDVALVAAERAAEG
jgi:serine phosphatase RsbU (regulator of sigma subunit)